MQWQHWKSEESWRWNIFSTLEASQRPEWSSWRLRWCQVQTFTNFQWYCWCWFWCWCWWCQVQNFTDSQSIFTLFHCVSSSFCFLSKGHFAGRLKLILHKCFVLFPFLYLYCQCYHERTLGWEAKFSEIESLVNDVNYEMQRVERWAFLFTFTFTDLSLKNGNPWWSLSLSLICLLRKMIHCELSLSNFDSWSRGKEDKDNVVLYFDSWPRQEQCITLPLKQVKNTRILPSTCYPRVVFSLKATIIHFESTLADFELLLQGHDHQRGQACCCVSLRLLQHWWQVGNNSQSYRLWNDVIDRNVNKFVILCFFTGRLSCTDLSEGKNMFSTLHHMTSHDIKIYRKERANMYCLPIIWSGNIQIKGFFFLEL